MKAYQKFKMEVLELEEDIVRTSDGQTALEDPISKYDDVISDFVI